MHPRTLAAAQLHDRLRTVLLTHFDTTPPELLTAAIAYELASLIAAASATLADAIDLVHLFADAEVGQIRAMGVGHPHP